MGKGVWNYVDLYRFLGFFSLKGEKAHKQGEEKRGKEAPR